MTLKLHTIQISQLAKMHILLTVFQKYKNLKLCILIEIMKLGKLQYVTLMLSLDSDLKEHNLVFHQMILGLGTHILTATKNPIGQSKEFKIISTAEEDIKMLQLLKTQMVMDVQFGQLNSILIDIKPETGSLYLLFNQITMLLLPQIKFKFNKYNYLPPQSEEHSNYHSEELF